MKVTVKHSAEMASLREVGKSLPEIVKMYPMYSRATVYRHANQALGQEAREDKRKNNPGRPSKITARDERRILRAIPRLRESEGSFSSPRIGVAANVAERMSNRTIRRCLNKHGYGYFRMRKKGLLTAEDRKKRVKFCNRIKSLRNEDFWKTHISMYLDGVGFQFKTRPLDQARTPQAREWRTRGEGLKLTTKGKKEGSVNTNFIVALSYNRGVVLCERYEGAITGQKYADIIDRAAPEAFRKSIAPRARRILQDGCPRQNSRVAMEAMDRNGAMVFKIPPRSPDLNPIENWFHIIKRRLRQQALDRQIEYETFEEFTERVQTTMLECPVSDVDAIIDSMGKRVNEVISSGGYRTKY